MQRNLHRGGLSIAAFALGLILTVPSARAEDPEQKADAPTPEEPREITSADFAIEANAVEDRLSQIRTEMSIIDVSEEVNAALDEIEAEGAELQEQFNALETRRMMISELNALQVQLGFLDARTKRQIDKLSVYAGDLEELETQNDEDIEAWTRAVRAIRKPSIPKSVRNRTASILQGLREGRKELDKGLGEVLALQTRALDVRDSVQMAEQGVMLAQRFRVMHGGVVGRRRQDHAVQDPCVRLTSRPPNPQRPSQRRPNRRAVRDRAADVPFQLLAGLGLLEHDDPH